VEFIRLRRSEAAASERNSIPKHEEGDMETQTINKQKGFYLGTEVQERWWHRYRGDKMFTRSDGEYWLDDDYFYFHRFFTRNTICVPLANILEVKIGRWHSGRWALGKYILKLVWHRNGKKLSSGFVVPSQHEVLGLKKEIEERLNER